MNMNKYNLHKEVYYISQIVVLYLWDLHLTYKLAFRDNSLKYASQQENHSQNWGKGTSK
jgi:hypothetical protein